MMLGQPGAMHLTPLIPLHTGAPNLESAPPGTHTSFSHPARQELLPRHHLRKPKCHSQMGIFSPKRRFIFWLSVPEMKACTPRGTEWPQQRCFAADMWLFSTSLFPKAQFRLKRINCGFPQTLASSLQLGSWQQHTEGLASATKLPKNPNKTP